ncbi:hypothetical protein [Sphingobacterium bovistauri]|uniref:Outer membrane protein beta-barrel domain-containing protein n=1 Tax=Sphingobacterium bovistauri TaxID=2781959 RepID=A0ABS7Z750_9SPHI|nr:hypothetical protein [Sphingobacterium bovistauri]MCA5005382.1 hypothetical protein [Sphingobacterium bovistauri]
MIKTILTTFLFCCFITVTFSQGQKFGFIEGGGSGVLVNANFDMRLKKESRDGIGFKLGLGNTFYLEDGKATTIPIGINYLIGKNKSGLLLGLNNTFSIFGKGTKKFETKSVVPSLELGYRFRPLEKGFAFQVTYNPLFNTVDGTMPIFFGIGLGYAWK